MKLKKLICIVLMVALAGCASVGLSPPQSMQERIAYAYATDAGIRASAAKALILKQITKADAVRILALTDDAQIAIGAAEAANSGGMVTDAASQLLTANAFLNQVQAFLNSKGGAK